MLNREKIHHILRAAATLTGQASFVMVGSGAMILNARTLPATMMLTPEVDIYAPHADDVELVSEIIDGSLGRDSPFHARFGYFCDGVSPTTAILPAGWEARQKTHLTPDDIRVVCPENDDVALSKLCAWREKDIDWPKVAARSGLIRVEMMAERLADLPIQAPTLPVLLDRLAIIKAATGR